MNIVLQQPQFNIHSLSFLDKKQNIIFDGVFTKILFSNELFTMNGIYLHFSIDSLKINDNKTIVSYQPYHKMNLQNIQQISNIEIDILEYYQKMMQSNKCINNVLSKILYTGNIKIFSQMRVSNTKFYPPGGGGEENAPQKSPLASKNYVVSGKFYIKISGIWETADEIGITYKIYKI